MTKLQRTAGLALALVTCLGACGLESDENARGELYDDDHVAVHSAGLGAITTLFTINNAQRLLAMSSTLTLMASDPGASCNPNGSLWRLRHVDSGPQTFFACSPRYRNGGISGGGTGYVWDDAANAIVRVTNLGLTTIKTSVSSIAGTILADAGSVYFADTLGIQKTPSGGGQTVNILSGNWYLLALDDDQILFSKRVSATTHELHRVSTTGSGHQTLLTMTNSQPFVDFAVGPNSYFWVDNGTSTRRLDIFVKATGARATIVSTTTGDTFRHPTPTPDGSKVYFVRRSVAGLGSIIINKIEGDAIIPQTSGVLEILDMAASNTSLTWVEDAVTSKRVKRAPH